jgi:S-adenosylmethionine hydrolase
MADLRKQFGSRSDIRDLENKLHDLSCSVNELKKRLQDEVSQTAKMWVLEEMKRCGDSIDDKIEKRFKTAFIFAGSILIVLGGLGYLGLQTSLPRMVRQSVGTSTSTEIESIRKNAVNALGDIEKAQIAAKSNPLIVLQTDYGTKAPYMGTLMGVIYNINPQARVQVITSEIEDFDVRNAAWVLWRASRFYPPGTIFVVITNPGGLTSRPVLIITNNGHYYLGHDNGCFDLVVQDYGYKAGYAIASPDLSPKEFRDLFGGSDTFGPAASKLSLGFPLDKVGPSIGAYVPKLPGVRHVIDGNKITGTIMDTDKYGNMTTNLTETDLTAAGIRIGAIVQAKFGDKILTMPMKETYGHVSKGSPVAIVYEGLLQFAINEGSFSKAYSIANGSEVTITIH